MGIVGIWKKNGKIGSGSRVEEGLGRHGPKSQSRCQGLRGEEEREEGWEGMMRENHFCG